MVASEHGDAADHVIGLVGAPPDALEGAAHGAQERRLRRRVPDRERVAHAAQLEAHHAGDPIHRRLAHVDARAEVAELLARREEQPHAQARRRRRGQPLEQGQQNRHGGGVVVGAGAAGDRVVVGHEHQRAVAAAEVDDVVVAAAFERREPMPRERHAARGEPRGHRRLARGVVARGEQTRERERRAWTAQHRVERRRRLTVRGRPPLEHATHRAVQASAHEEADVAQRHQPMRSRRRALSDACRANTSSGSPRSSATRAAVSAR